MGKVFNDACMTDDDFRNLEHDVQRHEGDLDRQLQQIQSLKKDMRELVDLVRLMSKFVHRDFVSRSPGSSLEGFRSAFAQTTGKARHCVVVAGVWLVSRYYGFKRKTFCRKLLMIRDLCSAPGQARTVNLMIRSHKADSEQAVKIDDSFYLNGGFQVDIAPVDVLARMPGDLFADTSGNFGIS
jgi:hypothetical protein